MKEEEESNRVGVETMLPHGLKVNLLIFILITKNILQHFEKL